MAPPQMAAIGDEDKSDTPPGDDCCPICFGSYTVPCKTNCGHWFCANCILMFWNHRNALQRCKCPICSSLISKLTPETSLALQQDAEVVEALKKVKKYNRLFVGGAYGLVMKVQQLPLLCTAMCRGLLNPDRLRENYVAVRLIALLLTGLYKICGFEFMHKDFWGVRFAIEIPALVMVLVLCIVGLYRRHFRMPHRVRLLGGVVFSALSLTTTTTTATTTCFQYRTHRVSFVIAIKVHRIKIPEIFVTSLHLLDYCCLCDMLIQLIRLCSDCISYS